jgi:3-deoxy-D-manno-octulosonic-acid transferase
MTLIFYNLALIVALILGTPWWLWRMATQRKYRAGLRERLGWIRPELMRGGETAPGYARPLLWLHAVSVGEVLAVSRLVVEIDREFPGHRLVVSTTTRTGQELARARFGAERVFYCPLDLPWAVRTYVNTLKPELLILTETEFWPNLLSNCFRRAIPVAVVNARISDRSWPRYLRLRRWWRPMLSQLSRVLAQSEHDAQRLITIGCRPLAVSVAGNLKFDVRAGAESEAARMLATGARDLRYVVAGSTLEGEEAALLEVWPRLLTADPDLALVLAPRHPERFEAVSTLLRGSSFSWTRRSEWSNERGTVPAPRGAQIVLLDTIGELASVYSLASVAFVGGSLVAAGGHNPLEPVQFGVPIVLGPHYANFRAIVDELRAHDAIRIAARDELSAALVDLLTDSAAARAMGGRARAVFEAQSGATARTIEALKELISSEVGAEREA